MRTDVRQAYDPAEVPSRLVGLVVGLANGLRAAGVPVATSETLEAVTALAAVGPADRGTVRAALRTTLVKDAAQDAVFARLFDLLFPHWPAAAGTGAEGLQAPAGPATGGVPGGEQELGAALVDALRRGDDHQVEVLLQDAVRQWAGIDGSPGSERHHLRRVLRRLDLNGVLQQVARGDPERSELRRRVDTAEAAAAVERVQRLLEQLVAERVGERPAAAPRPLEVDIADRPILRAGPDEIAALRAAVRPLARRLATRLGRRRRRGQGRLDVRRTIRRSMSSGGVPIEPQLRRRSPTKPDLVILCDVSGSVAQYAPFALALLGALHTEFRRVRSWVFVDGIVEVTDVLAATPGVVDAHRLLARRGLVAGDGRSDYSRAFAAFLAGWDEHVSSKTTVLVIGDARSHGRRPALAETAELHRLARRLYWLNPEPRREWDTGDSVMGHYAAHSTQVFEVSTLRQLAACVAAIA
jgi:uncharacterized protein